MLTSILLILGGLLLLIGGAETLVRAGTKLALQWGVAPILVGLTFVAWGTSSPELMVCVEAALGGNSDIALGNIIGSNIGNLALVLALSALVFPLHVPREFVTHEMTVAVAAPVLLWVLCADGELGRVDGALLLLGALVHTSALYRSSRSRPEAEKERTTERKGARFVWAQIALITVGVALLGVGARLFIDGALQISRSLGVSEIVIGLTVVAVGTNLPELVISLVAAWKKTPDMIVGNVIGSNIINITLILGVTALIHPIGTRNVAATDWIAVIGFALATWLLLRYQRALNRPAALGLLLGYAVYIYTLV